MKYRFPKAIEKLEPYQPITGKYAVRLDANESCFDLEPEKVQDFSRKLEEISFNRYPDPYAEKLCASFADYYGIDRNLVTAFNGSDELLSLLAGTFFTEGQKLAVFDHDFSMYGIYGEIFGASCQVIPKKPDLTISAADTLAYIEEHDISALLFSNPCNPTSLGLCREEVIRLIEGTDALILLDEAYMDFWDQSVLDLAGTYSNLIVLRTCSKAAGLAAARLGFAVTTPALTKVLRSVKSPYNVNTLSQAMGEVLLGDREYLKMRTGKLIESRKMLEAELRRLTEDFEEITEVFPSKTNFVFLRCRNSKDIYAAMLEKSIAIRLMGEYLRITAGTMEENQMMLRALAVYLKENRRKRT